MDDGCVEGEQQKRQPPPPAPAPIAHRSPSRCPPPPSSSRSGVKDETKLIQPKNKVILTFYPKFPHACSSTERCWFQFSPSPLRPKSKCNYTNISLHSPPKKFHTYHIEKQVSTAQNAMNPHSTSQASQSPCLIRGQDDRGGLFTWGNLEFVLWEPLFRPPPSPPKKAYQVFFFFLIFYFHTKRALAE